MSAVVGVGEGRGDDGPDRMPFSDHRVMATSDFEEADAAVRTVFPAVRLPACTAAQRGGSTPAAVRARRPAR
jgi:hypothetical protein